jgi:hypothetical protein
MACWTPKRSGWWTVNALAWDVSTWHRISKRVSLKIGYPKTQLIIIIFHLNMTIYGNAHSQTHPKFKPSLDWFKEYRSRKPLVLNDPYAALSDIMFLMIWSCSLSSQSLGTTSTNQELVWTANPSLVRNCSLKEVHWPWPPFFPDRNVEQTAGQCTADSWCPLQWMEQEQTTASTNGS